MPLLHRKPFIPNPTILDLDPDDEIFYCPLTKEMFTDYDEFFERTILCNSLVWSCSITNRPNMTYQEALDHENAARKKFQKFPKHLQKPVLYLVKLASRSRIEELNDAIFSFVKKRFFIGEEVEVRVKTNKFENARILDVFPVKGSMKGGVNGHVNGGLSGESGEDDDDDRPLSKLFHKQKALEPDQVQYQVKLLGPSMDPVRIVPWTAPRRKMKREQCKIFLKTTCMQDHEQFRTYHVKESVAKRLGLEDTRWEDLFAGPEPALGGRSPKAKKVLDRTEDKKAAGTKKALTAKAKEEHMLQKQAKAREEMLLQEMKKQEREMKQEAKKREAEEAKRLKQIAMEQRKKDYRERVEKMREVKRRLAEYKKQWSKQRDDLECDDLKDLPAPQEVITRVPPHLFGEVLSLLEFFHTFEALFDAKDEFPRGVSLDLLERAIIDEDQDGPLCDLLFFFLSNLFRTHTEEEGEKFYVPEPGDAELANNAEENPCLENLVATATLASTWPSKYQGCPINKLELDSYTVSEVLRLYLLTSAARVTSDNRLWRSQQRGGYGVSDDTPLRMCLSRPELIHKLSQTSIFNFTPDEKLEILLCLSTHLISYVTPRDFMEDMAEKLFAAKLDYREDKRSEKKREKDFIADRLKWKNAQAILEREKKLKDLANNAKRDQNDQNENNIAIENRSDQAVPSEDQDEHKLMTSEEQMEHLKMLDEEEKVAKEAFEFRKIKHIEEIAQHQKFKMLSIGEDRFFRRYWILNCVPGLLVEEYPDEYLTDDILRVKVPQQGQAAWNWSSGTMSVTRTPNNSVATPTEQNTQHPLVPIALVTVNMQPIKHESHIAQANGDPVEHVISPGVTAAAMLANGNSEVKAENDSCSSTDPGTQGKASRWFIYTEKEDIERFLSALNMRGHRESKLHDSISANKRQLFRNLDSRPNNELCQKRSESEEAKRRARSRACKKAIELALRDQILDLESRIFEGTLGGIKVLYRLVQHTPCYRYLSCYC